MPHFREILIRMAQVDGTAMGPISALAFSLQDPGNVSVEERNRLALEAAEQFGVDLKDVSVA